ncbi:aspartate aminotransferase family protein [Microbacterium lacticum]
MMELITDWPLSQGAWARSRASLAGGVSTGLRAAMPPHPLSFDSGVGAHLRDIDGNVYTDYVLGWGPLFLGHSHPAVVEEVGTQLRRGQTFGSGHRYEYLVAEQVLAAVPGAERVLWSNTGTEANQIAFRLARAHTGRQRVVKFAGHYHGWQDNVLVSYRGPDALSSPEPAAGTAGQSRAAMSDVRVAQWNDLDSVEALLADPAESIAAVIVEPVLANTGVLTPAAGFLNGLKALCARYGCVLIFDEVITGFRLALGGAREYFGIVPDLSVLAKGIASGLPLSAVTGRADIIDRVTDDVSHAGTYNGNPIVLAAAHATLAVLRETDPYARLSSLADRMAKEFARALDGAGVTGTAHAVGPIVQVALGIPSLTTVPHYMDADWAAYDRLLVELLRRRQFALPGGRWYLSTAHTSEDVDETVAAFRLALAALQGGEGVGAA